MGEATYLDAGAHRFLVRRRHDQEMIVFVANLRRLIIHFVYLFLIETQLIFNKSSLESSKQFHVGFTSLIFQTGELLMYSCVASLIFLVLCPLVRPLAVLPVGIATSPETVLAN